MNEMIETTAGHRIKFYRLTSAQMRPEKRGWRWYETADGFRIMTFWGGGLEVDCYDGRWHKDSFNRKDAE